MNLFDVRVFAPVLGATATRHDGATSGWGICCLRIDRTVGGVGMVLVVVRGCHYHHWGDACS